MATKVCHMTSAHGPEDVRIFVKECRSLAKAGYEVYLVERGDTYDKDGVHIIGIGQVSGGRLHRMWTVARQVYEKALALDCNIYHFHDPELLPYGLKLKKRGKKVIFDSHENTAGSILEKEWIPSGLRRLVYCLYSKYECYVCRKLDAVIYVSPNVEEYYRWLNSKSVMVTNYPICKGKVEKKQPNKDLVFAGGISGQWNHEAIIQAVERVPQCRYVLCGFVDGDYLKKLESLPAWGNQVDFLGKIPHMDVQDVLVRGLAGMALLSPGRNTSWQMGTMGNTKIFEEMMAGLPVICTDFILWREFVDRYHCGICVNPKNVGEITNAINYLLDNPHEARIMGENGRRAVEEEFNWDTQEERLVALYRELENGGV